MHDDLSRAFAAQARACRDLGSPFTAALMTALVRHWPAAAALDARAAGFGGDLGPAGVSLPLRVAGGLHHLQLTGAEPALARVWPPDGDAGLLDSVLPGVLQRQDRWLAAWIEHAPQTNEVGRSAVLLAFAAELVGRTGLPLRISELGASAGLNLHFDRYALCPEGGGPEDAASGGGGLAIGRVTGPEAEPAPGPLTGQADSPLRLAPDWRGRPPRPGPVPVVERRGVDLNPLSPQRDALRLLAYVWPDQPERLSRLRLALSLAAGDPAPVDRGDAAPWLAGRLDGGLPGTCHLVFSTVAFQYFPPATQAAIAAMMAAAGARATPDSPLAWAAMEADATPGGAALTLRLWPGDLRLVAGRAGFHGQWVDWRL